MSEIRKKEKRQRWYFGGLASAGADCFTHPLGLIKVLLQTQGTVKLPVVKTVLKIIKQDGFLKLYNGISASITFELLYSTARFGIYQTVKQYLPIDSGLGTNILLAGSAGAVSSLIGVPADTINVRMENDMKLPMAQRRNYKHVFDGLLRVSREEGIKKLYSSTTPILVRGSLFTIGQIAFYDYIKSSLLASDQFEDDRRTHFIASIGAGSIATTLTQPFDVLKTRVMNAKAGEFNGVLDVIKCTAKLGPFAFYKGFIPAFIKIGPHTVLTFFFLETLRLHFGYFPD